MDNYLDFDVHINLLGNQLVSSRVHQSDTIPFVYGSGQMWWDYITEEFKIYDNTNSHWHRLNVDSDFHFNPKVTSKDLPDDEDELLLWDPVISSYRKITKSNLLQDLGNINNAYSYVTDGINTAVAIESDTIKVRTSNDILQIVVENDNITHGDNILFTIDESKINHDNLIGGIGNRHIDHSLVKLQITGTANEIEVNNINQYDITVSRSWQIGLPDIVVIQDSLQVDTINERTLSTGVTIDGVLLKDSKIGWSYISNTPTTLSGYGIIDTKVNFNNACSDGTFLFLGGGSNTNYIAVFSDTGEISGYSTFQYDPVNFIMRLETARSVNIGVSYPLELLTTYDGVVGNGLGSGLKFLIENSSSFNETAGSIYVKWTDITIDQEEATMVFNLMSGGVESTVMSLTGIGLDVNGAFETNSTVTLTGLGSDDTEDHLLAIDNTTGLVTKRSVASIISEVDVSWGTPSNYYVVLGDSTSGKITSSSDISYSTQNLYINNKITLAANPGSGITVASGSSNLDLIIQAGQQTVSGEGGNLFLNGGKDYTTDWAGDIYINQNATEVNNGGQVYITPNSSGTAYQGFLGYGTNYVLWKIERSEVACRGGIGTGYQMVEEEIVATPASGFGRIYPKIDGKIYYKNSTGIEYDLTDVGESGASTFLELTDTPSAYTGTGGYLVRVNSTSDGLEFVDGSTLFALLSHNHDSEYISIISTPTTGNFPIITSGGELQNSIYNSSSFAAISHTHSTSDITDLSSYTGFDSRYYTETELQTSGQSFVHWDNITNKPNIVSIYGTPADNQVAVFRSATEIEGSNYLTWDGRTLGVSSTILTGGSTTKGLSSYMASGTVSLNEANNVIGLFNDIGSTYNIASGITDSGYRAGLNIYSRVIDADFLGTLNIQYGEVIYYGHGTGAGTGTINTAYGLVVAYLESGSSTVNTSMSLYFSGNPDYAIYNDGTGKIYTAGDVGIGITTPGAKLDVNGTFKTNDIVTFTGIGNVTKTDILYYDSATGVVTYGAAPSGGGVAWYGSTLNGIASYKDADEAYVSSVWTVTDSILSGNKVDNIQLDLKYNSSNRVLINSTSTGGYISLYDATSVNIVLRGAPVGDVYSYFKGAQGDWMVIGGENDVYGSFADEALLQIGDNYSSSASSRLGITGYNSSLSTQIGCISFHNTYVTESTKRIVEIAAYSDAGSAQDGRLEWWITNSGTLTKRMVLDKSGNLYVAANGYFYNTTWPSDLNLKNIISGISALNIIEQLNPVSFKWKNGFDDKLHYGFIAQDVQKILPDLVSVRKDPFLDKEFLDLNYTEFIPILAGGINEVKSEIDILKIRIKDLEAEVKKLKSK